MIPTAPATPCSEHSAAASSASARSEIGEPLRPRLTANELDAISLTELVQNWKDLDVYTEWLDNQAASQEVENANLRQYLERVKQQHLEACSRERAVLRRLATKEQEIQELMAQITDLKTSATPSAGSLRAALLDPAVNLLLQKLRTELATSRAQLEETQNELSAWKFTPDSNTGKRLMAKCRLLYQENEELGKLVASGRMAKLEGELALQKTLAWKSKNLNLLDEFLQELDEDVEGMQSTVYYLQQELRKSRETISALERKLIKYKKFKKDGDDENDEDVSESEEPKEDWKETGDVEVEGEGWTEWKEGDNGDDDWNQWEEEEEERVNNYAEEEQPADWSEDNKDPSNIETLKLSGNAPKTGKVSLKRTKPSEGDLNDCFDSPVQKRLKTASLQAENTKDITIASGVNENKEAPADGKE